MAFLALSSPAAVSDRALLGGTEQRGRTVVLPRERLGKFWTLEWKHVAAVIDIELPRPPAGDVRYGCVVLLNPVAIPKASAGWFPRAHVAVLEGEVFRWKRGQQCGPAWLPDGTTIVP